MRSILIFLLLLKLALRSQFGVEIKVVSIRNFLRNLLMF